MNKSGKSNNSSNSVKGSSIFPVSPYGNDIASLSSEMNMNINKQRESPQPNSILSKQPSSNTKKAPTTARTEDDIVMKGGRSDLLER
jgi:hypothetical protein